MDGLIFAGCPSVGAPNVALFPNAGARVVAEGAADPDHTFYVESPAVGVLTDDMRCTGVFLYHGPQQSGKTTDALAVCRRLREKNMEVRHMLAVALPPNCCLAMYLAAFLSLPFSSCPFAGWAGSG